MNSDLLYSSVSYSVLNENIIREVGLEPTTHTVRNIFVQLPLERLLNSLFLPALHLPSSLLPQAYTLLSPLVTFPLTGEFPQAAASAEPVNSRDAAAARELVRGQRRGRKRTHADA